MTLTLATKDVAGMLGAVRSLVGGPLPILSSVLVEVNAGGVHITGTNLDQTLTTTCPKGGTELVTEAVSIAVNHAKLFEIVRATSGANLELEYLPDKKVLKVRSGSSFFSLLCHDPAEFPPTAGLVKARAFEFKAKDLGRALAGVAHAMSSDESRYILNGILFRFEQDAFIAVGTDGRRLAYSTIRLERGQWDGEPCEFVVPSRAIALLQQMAVGDRPLHMAWTGAAVRFSVESTCLQSKLIDGNFPNWRMVIPSESGFTHRLELNREEMEKTVRLASHMATDEKQWVYLRLSRNSLLVESAETNHGYGRAVLTTKAPEQTAHIAFNPQYLLSALSSQSEHPTVRLNLGASMDPAVLETQDWTCVVMPMRAV
jgi:DNA polymerase-3 subunit beta